MHACGLRQARCWGCSQHSPNQNEKRKKNVKVAVAKGHTKNGTMHSKFQLKNVTNTSEFNERTNNYFQKNYIEKITETKPVK